MPEHRVARGAARSARAPVDAWADAGEWTDVRGRSRAPPGARSGRPARGQRVEQGERARPGLAGALARLTATADASIPWVSMSPRPVRSQSSTIAGVTSGWNWIPALRPAANAWQANGVAARTCAPGGSATMSSCHANQRPASGDSPSTSIHPISGAGARRTEPPRAAARAWAPKQMPSTARPRRGRRAGTRPPPRSMDRSRRARSGRSPAPRPRRPAAGRATPHVGALSMRTRARARPPSRRRAPPGRRAAARRRPGPPLARSALHAERPAHERMHPAEVRVGARRRGSLGVCHVLRFAAAVNAGAARSRARRSRTCDVPVGQRVGDARRRRCRAPCTR